MRTHILSLSSALLVAGTALAQSDYQGPANLVYTMDSTVRLASANTDDAAIVSDDGVMMHSPGVTPFAYPFCDYGTWSAFFGDEDNDGQYGDSIITAIDALHVPPGASAPSSFFDVWFSIQTPTDPGGFLGVAVSDGDIIRLKNDGSTTGIETFISQGQIINACGSASTNVDVTAFTIDNATGDLYMSFSAGVDVNGTTAADGDIVCIPGSSLTLTGGVVTAVTPGAAVIALTEAEIDAMFMNAGYNGVSDVSGIEIDPTGGTFTSTVTNVTMPHFWLCDDDAADEGLCSTKNDPLGGLPGVIPSINGVPMLGAVAFGLSGSFSTPGVIGNPFGIAFQLQTPQGPTPMHADSFPSFQTTPNTFNVDASGATPNGFTVYVFDLVDESSPGLFPARSAFSPIGVFLGPSWQEYYPPIPSLGVVLVGADAEGFTRLPITINVPFPGFGAIIQVGDLTSLTLSAPCLISFG